MKKVLLFLTTILIFQFQSNAQFDFYGPRSFGNIINSSFPSTGILPSTISNIENRKYGINLYNILDYDMCNHPPVIGISYDGIALFGRYESTHSSMVGLVIV